MAPLLESSDSLQAKVGALGGTSVADAGKPGPHCTSHSLQSIRHGTFHAWGSRPVVPVRARTPPVVQFPLDAERLAARAASQGQAPRCSPLGAGRETRGVGCRTPWALLEQARGIGRKARPSPPGRRHGFEAVGTSRQQTATLSGQPPVRGGVPASCIDDMAGPDTTPPQKSKDVFLAMCSRAMVLPRRHTPVKLTPAMERIVRGEMGEMGIGQRGRTPRAAGDHLTPFSSMTRCRDISQPDTMARRLPGSPMLDREVMTDLTPRTLYLARGMEETQTQLHAPQSMAPVLSAMAGAQRTPQNICASGALDPAKGNEQGTRPVAHIGENHAECLCGNTEGWELLERWEQPSGAGSSAATRSQSAPPLLGWQGPTTCTIAPATTRRCRSTAPTEFRMPVRLSAAMQRLALRKAGKDHAGRPSPWPEQPKAPSPMRRLVDMQKVKDIFALYPLRSRSQHRNEGSIGPPPHIVTKCDESSVNAGSDCFEWTGLGSVRQTGMLLALP